MQVSPERLKASEFLDVGPPFRLKLIKRTDDEERPRVDVEKVLPRWVAVSISRMEAFADGSGGRPHRLVALGHATDEFG